MYFNRRLMRRQRKVVLFSTALLLVIIVYIVIFVEDHKIAEEHFRPFSERCISTASEKLITELCSNFTKGIAYGSFCPALCIDNSVKVSSCIHHGTTYVLNAEHQGEHIVIKKKRPHNIQLAQQLFEDSIKGVTNMEDIHKAFIDRLTDEVRSMFGADSRQLFIANLRRISKQLFGKQIDELTLAELRNSWFLIGQDELIVMALHQDMESFPKLRGTCGPVYVMEGIQPYSDFFPQIRPSMPWDRRVTIAKNFLNFIRDFEKSGVGRLHHCDMQEANFGLTKELKVKAIDVDLIYSPDRIDELLPQPECSKDEECDFFDCNSKCDAVSKKCSTQQTTNNLMIMCRDIFLPGWPNNGLLTNFQPTSIKKHLNTLIEDCKSETFGKLPMDHHTVLRVMDDIEKLLDRSLVVKSP